MRYFYLFLFCLLYRIEFIQAQNLYFGYDDSGNQVLRKLEYDEVRDPISRLLQPESIDPSAVGEPIMLDMWMG